MIIDEMTPRELEEMGRDPFCGCGRRTEEQTLDGRTFVVCEDCGASEEKPRQVTGEEPW